MATDISEILVYQLPELSSPRKAADIPLTPSKLAKWLESLPLLNVNQLSYSIPKYIQQLNQINISDKDRFAMLEHLRPVVAHLYMSLTKRFTRRNLDLSRESQEIQWLTREMIHGMAVGYQRLLSSIAQKKIGMMNRHQYTVLAQRTMYYLSEHIRLSYMLCCVPPKGAWLELNCTYSYALKQGLTNTKLKDDLAYFDEKGSIDTLYNRILVLSMVAPYSLRGAELEQVYYGLTSWSELIRIRENDASSHGYAIGFDDDYGPIYYPRLENIANKMMIDNSHLLRQLKRWQDSGDRPESFDNKGMTDKLLAQVAMALEAAKVESEEQYEGDNEPVEIVMGLQDIDLFLEHVDSIMNDDIINSPIPKVKISESELDTGSIHWDTLQFYTPTIQPTSARQVSMKKHVQQQATDVPTVRRHKFTVENESKMGACISCNDLHGSGLFIGEMMFIRGYDPQVWTLGIVRWMRISANKLYVGLYLLSAQVDSVVVNKEGTTEELTVNALWMADGNDDDTLLLPRAEFRTGNKLQLTHHDEDFFVTLGKDVWHSEGFAQFNFSTEAVEQSDSESFEEYLMPA
ncbi:MAG: hypothetical protein COA95_04665 [Methylophaga sp.]|nr:MAG: hypothetical protein COA95_04665 [Methylophaga sp.]